MSVKKRMQNYCILTKDDDIDNQYMIKQTFTSVNLNENIKTVNGGFELMEYKNKKVKYSSLEIVAPKLILLNLNMPKKDGRECLKEIKTNSLFKNISIAIYSSSSNPNNISYTHEIGDSSYITKPYSNQEIKKTILVFKQYWFEIINISFI